MVCVGVRDSVLGDGAGGVAAGDRREVVFGGEGGGGGGLGLGGERLVELRLKSGVAEREIRHVVTEM